MKKELSYLETLKMIGEIKGYFEKQLSVRLSLIKVQSPLFVRSDTGLQDELSGVEKSISFKKGKDKYEIVHSLAKWKRYSLGKYEFPLYKGILTDMKAIRRDEKVDCIHSMYVEQYDWEKVISKEDRTIDYLKDTVRSIYKSLRETIVYMKKQYRFLTIDLPKTIYFISSQELEDRYPDKTPKEREQLIGKEKGSVFIYGIGDKLKSGIEHDLRSPDYDDWELDGDLLVYDKTIDRVIELTSMGIRVDEKSLVSQLEKAGCTERLELPYHQAILKKELPYTIGGGIGISRIIMLILGKTHIAEAQASSWDDEILTKLKDKKVL